MAGNEWTDTLAGQKNASKSSNYCSEKKAATTLFVSNVHMNDELDKIKNTYKNASDVKYLSTFIYIILHDYV